MDQDKLFKDLERNKRKLMGLLMEFSLVSIPDPREINEVRNIISDLEDRLEINPSNEPCIIKKMGITSLIEMSKIMEGASESELFVFDFDETFATNRYMFWGSGLVEYDPKHNFNEYIPFPGFEDIMTLVRNRNVLILTARGCSGIKDANNFMKKYGFEIPIIGTCRAMSKGEMMIHILRASRKYTIVHFIDDCEKNLASVEESLALNCTDLTLYTYQAPCVSHEKCDPNLSKEERDKRIEDYKNRKYCY